MLRRLLDSPRTYYLLAGILLVVAVLSQFEIRLPSRPQGGEAELAALRTRDDVNLIFILVDTLRADRLHAYGYARETSPWMDEMARTGVRFDRVLSQSSWTKTSMASLMTATYPVRNGILRLGHGMPEEAPLPAERLREAGFRTAGIFRNGWVAPNFGFGQGFQSYIRPLARRLTPGRQAEPAPPRAAQGQRRGHHPRGAGVPAHLRPTSGSCSTSTTWTSTSTRTARSPRSSAPATPTPTTTPSTGRTRTSGRCSGRSTSRGCAIAPWWCSPRTTARSSSSTAARATPRASTGRWSRCPGS